MLPTPLSPKDGHLPPPEEACRLRSCVFGVTFWVRLAVSIVLMGGWFGSQIAWSQERPALVCEGVPACIDQVTLGETIAARRLAARVLGERQDARALPALLVALAEDSAQVVRQAAAEALGRLGRAEARAGLLAALGDRVLVRRAAVTALGQVADAEVWQRLRGVLRGDADFLVRAATAQALATEGGAETTSVLLVAAAEDTHAQVRQAAILALGGRRLDALQRGVLRAALVAERRAFLRVAWLGILGSLVEDPGVHAAVVGLLRDDAEVEVRVAAARVLGFPGLEASLVPLTMAIRSDATLRVRLQALEALAAVGTMEAERGLRFYAGSARHRVMRERARDLLQARF